ncbi:MAG: hypothetical protein CL868_07000 [Cytophagaceae bacterium]|nr:hypothetical protein [Cytophagaceae bacterium]|tara:strand:- start:33210 stop:33608 length:399 start_codon:yes stop_codon:yes gene_type:complete
MFTIRALGRFLFLFGFVAVGTYVLHCGLETGFFEDPAPPLLTFAYKFNFGITFVFTTTIIFLSKRFNDVLGYIFLVGSAVKLIAFIFIIKTRGFTIDKTVFFDFFIPYICCLALEIYIVAKLLNNSQNIDKQ